MSPARSASAASSTRLTAVSTCGSSTAHRGQCCGPLVSAGAAARSTANAVRSGCSCATGDVAGSVIPLAAGPGLRAERDSPDFSRDVRPILSGHCFKCHGPDETVREGVFSFGAPVFDASGQVVAGVAVCINRALLGADHGERHREVALGVARTLSRRLGGDVPDLSGAKKAAPVSRRRSGGA